MYTKNEPMKTSNHETERRQTTEDVAGPYKTGCNETLSPFCTGQAAVERY